MKSLILLVISFLEGKSGLILKCSFITQGGHYTLLFRLFLFSKYFSLQCRYQCISNYQSEFLMMGSKERRFDLLQTPDKLDTGV